MGLIDLKFGKLKIPLYDLATLSAAFYIGYNEGKGIDTSAIIEYLTKYGPTAFAMTTTPLAIKIANTFGKLMHRKVVRNLQNENLEFTLANGTKKKYRDLTGDEKREMIPKIVNNLKSLESKLKNPKYLKPTLTIGARTAIETTVAYVAGRVYSQIN